MEPAPSSQPKEGVPPLTGGSSSALDPLQPLLTSDDTSDDDSDFESDEGPVLVIDSGDFTVKAGIAGHPAPLLEFAALVFPGRQPVTGTGDMPRMEDVREFYRDPQAAQMYTGALIRSHQLLSLAKLGDARLVGSGLAYETCDDDIMSHLAHFVRQSPVKADLLVGCDAGSLHIAEKTWRVGNEVVSRHERDRIATSMHCRGWRSAIVGHGWPRDRWSSLDWDALEIIWKHTFYSVTNLADTSGTKELITKAESRRQIRVLLTEPLLSPKAVRERMTKLVFDRFPVACLGFAPCPALALYSSATTTGVVLSCGFTCSTAFVVYEGHAMPHATNCSHLGGRDLTACMASLLDNKQTNATSTREHPMDLARRVKEQECYVALDFASELSRMDEALAYRFCCPEILFSPEMRMGMEDQRGVGVLVASSILSCDVDIRRDLQRNIVLEGASTLFPGFAERLQSEVVLHTTTIVEDARTDAQMKLNDIEARIEPMDESSSSMAQLKDLRLCSLRNIERNRVDMQQAAGATVKVIALDCHAAWNGASIVGSFNTFHHTCITRDEYEDEGPEIVHRKHFV